MSQIDRVKPAEYYWSIRPITNYRDQGTSQSDLHETQFQEYYWWDYKYYPIPRTPRPAIQIRIKSLRES